MIFLVVTISRDKILLILKNMPSNTQDGSANRTKALNTFRSKLRNYYFHYYKPYFYWYADKKIT